MIDKPEQALTIEYQVNVDLWKHDDDLRQQRNHTFLTMNTVLLVALGSLITLGDTVSDKALMAILISIFGLPVCFIWNRVQARNGEYIRFRRFQLRSIESRLPGFSTFANQYLAMDQHKEIDFQGLTDKFEISKPAMRIIDQDGGITPQCDRRILAAHLAQQPAANYRWLDQPVDRCPITGPTLKKNHPPGQCGRGKARRASLAVSPPGRLPPSGVQR